MVVLSFVYQVTSLLYHDDPDGCLQYIGPLAEGNKRHGASHWSRSRGGWEGYSLKRTRGRGAWNTWTEEKRKMVLVLPQSPLSNHGCLG